MAVFYKDLSRIIRLDKNISKIPSPELVLKTRDFRTLGNIPNYTNWRVSVLGNSIDEISFDVPKFVDGKLNPIWFKLTDLKVVELKRYGCFEIEVTYTDNTKTVKSINGYSLERELGQLILHDFHVNDDDAKTMIITEYNKKDFDSKGDFINTVFYNPDDTDHSLLHRILKEKAPHWSIGYVTDYISIGEDKPVKDVRKFYRSFTADGTSVYDFLTQDIAEECNVVFLFDTLHRQINCYSVINGLDKNGNVVKIAYGEDTNVYISKENLATEITLTPNVDQIKNCFRIEGGDDTITANVRTVNVSGSNYIYNFGALKDEDMPSELTEKLNSYQEFLDSKAKGYENLMLELQNAYSRQSELKYTMSPADGMKDDLDAWVSKTAREQFFDIKQKLINGKIGVEDIKVASVERINNNIESMAQVYSDTRFTVEVVTDGGICKYDNNKKIWTGTIVVKRLTDNSMYPPSKDEYKNNTFQVAVVNDDYNLTYTQQKLKIALAESDIFNIDTDISNMTTSQMREYFKKYSLSRLYSFNSAYDTAVSLLQEAFSKATNTAEISAKVKEFLDKYTNIKIIVNECYKQRETECKEQDLLVSSLESQCSEYQKDCNMQTYLGDDLYKQLYKYIREDTYSNSNYISDNLTDAQAMDKARDLVEVAKKELEKACVCQRTISVTLNNIFALPEFEPLYDSFQLYNYIRVRTEDELLKLRILGLEISGDSLDTVTVTFADKIESITGSTEDIKSILDQAKSISTTYNSTVKQADKGSQASDYVTDLRLNGLNAAKTMIKNDTSETFTITPAGAVAKRMDDVGFYGDKQIKFLGNGIYFTKDNWQTICQAIGEFVYTDENGNQTLDYGIIGKYVIGELIAGNQLVITAGNGKVRIDQDGITLSDGQVIKYEKDAPMSEIKLEFMNSDSSTVAPDANDSNWSSTCPQWEYGKYIWQKVTTTDANGNSEVSIVCISGRNGQDGTNGKDGNSFVTLITNYSYNQKDIDRYSASGYSGTWAVTDASNVKVGDEIMLRVTNTSKNGYCFIIAKVTQVNSSTAVTCTSVGLIDKGNTGNNGKDASLYQIESSVDYVERRFNSSTATVENCMNPSKIIFNGYVQTGDSTTRQSHLGKFTFAESTDGTNWTTTYATGQNVSSYTYPIYKSTSNWVKCTMSTNSGVALKTITVPIILSDSISTTKKQYYLSTSSSSVTGGSWSDTVPAWVGTSYIWSRTYIQYKSGYITYTSAVYESNLTSRLKDMTTFQTDTQNKLNALNPTTLVGNDYIFSPKIGGGYAYFTNRDGSYSVEIDPQHAAGDKTLDKYLFCIRKNGNTTPIMGVDSKGNGMFNGNVTAKQLELYQDNDKYGQFDMGFTPYNNSKYYGLGIMVNGKDAISGDSTHRRISFGVTPGHIHEDIYFTKGSDGNWSSKHIFYNTCELATTSISNLTTLNGQDYNSGWKPVSSYGSGISLYNNSSLYMRRVGKMVYLRGAVTNSSSITTTETSKKTLFTIASQFRPSYPHQSIQQGSGSNRWIMDVNKDGTVTLDRYSNNTATRNTVPTGAWLVCTTSWMVD